MNTPAQFFGFEVGITSGDDGAFFHTRAAAERFGVWAWGKISPNDVTTRMAPRREEIGDTPDRPWQTPNTAPDNLIRECADQAAERHNDWMDNN